MSKNFWTSGIQIMWDCAKKEKCGKFIATPKGRLCVVVAHAVPDCCCRRSNPRAHCSSRYDLEIWTLAQRSNWLFTKAQFLDKNLGAKSLVSALTNLLWGKAGMEEGGKGNFGG